MKLNLSTTLLFGLMACKDPDFGVRDNEIGSRDDTGFFDDWSQEDAEDELASNVGGFSNKCALLLEAEPLFSMDEFTGEAELKLHVNDQDGCRVLIESDLGVRSAEYNDSRQELSFLLPADTSAVWLHSRSWVQDTPEGSIYNAGWAYSCSDVSGFDSCDLESPTEFRHIVISDE